MTTEKVARRRILDAALKILRKQGVGALTQTRVAALAGLRQSHLTYYFPRKADLLAATLEASHARSSGRRAGKAADPLGELHALMFDRNRMRFFLGVVVETSDRPDLRRSVADHARGLTEQLAAVFGRTADDPDVTAFVDLLRGMGLRHLLEADQRRVANSDLKAVAERFGLSPIKADKN